MITRIRQVRQARGMTLDDVARRCRPATTPQTIGRLETGRRAVSLSWLNRIAEALGVTGGDLLSAEQDFELPVAAVLGQSGISAPVKSAIVLPPRAQAAQLAILVNESIGDYRSGDELWCTRVEPHDFGRGLNRDILVPRPSNRFLFGRMINRDDDKLHMLPLGAGGRQIVIANPPWLAIAAKLVRNL